MSVNDFCISGKSISLGDMVTHYRIANDYRTVARAEARRRNIRFIAYNTRFLILPWVRVPHLASHLLRRMAAILSDDWERMYSHPSYFAETFIDQARVAGLSFFIHRDEHGKLFVCVASDKLFHIVAVPPFQGVLLAFYAKPRCSAFIASLSAAIRGSRNLFSNPEPTICTLITRNWQPPAKRSHKS
jgi:Domain of unknown function (DUF4338)